MENIHIYIQLLNLSTSVMWHEIDTPSFHRVFHMIFHPTPTLMHFFFFFFLFHIETPTLDFTSNHKENSLNHPSFLEFSLYLFLQNYHFVLGFNKIFIERILPYFRYSNMQIIHHVNVARLSPKNLNAHHVIHFAIYTNGVILYMIHYHQEYSTFSTPSIIFHYYTCPF